MGCCDSSWAQSGDAEIYKHRNGANVITSSAEERNRVKQRSIGLWFALASIRTYQIFLGPFLGGGCRFSPSCSRYAYEAVERFGAVQGTWLAAKRLMRCRPFSPGGYDPVPEASAEREREAHDSRNVAASGDGRAVEVLR